MVLLSEYIIWFVSYSIIGWLYEEILCSIQQKHLVKRGFLKGPYCPIYGFGAMMNIFLFHNVDNVAALFFAGVITTCTLEYFTSWALEKLFHARWWDYSEMRFNLNGRVCLLGGVAFGSMIVLLMKFIHPWMSGLTAKMPDMAMVSIGSAVSALFIVDVVFTVLHMRGFNKKLKSLQQRIDTAMETTLTGFEEGLEAFRQQQKEKGEKLNLRMQERNFLNSFPSFQSNEYNNAVDQLRTSLKLRKDKKAKRHDKNEEQEK